MWFNFSIECLEFKICVFISNKKTDSADSTNRQKIKNEENGENETPNPIDKKGGVKWKVSIYENDERILDCRRRMKGSMFNSKTFISCHYNLRTKPIQCPSPKRLKKKLNCRNLFLKKASIIIERYKITLEK